MESIQIKYFTDKIDRLTYIGGVSDWIDLRCAEDVELSAGEFRLIPLGVAMKGMRLILCPGVPHLRISALSRRTIWGLLTRVTAAAMTSGIFRRML